MEKKVWYDVKSEKGDR